MLLLARVLPSVLSFAGNSHPDAAVAEDKEKLRLTQLTSLDCQVDRVGGVKSLRDPS